jgi:hypothetical protein
VTSDRNHQTTEQQFLPWIRCHRIAGRNAINADGGRGTTWIICILSRGPMVQSLVTSSTISKLTAFKDTRGAGPRATGQWNRCQEQMQMRLVSATANRERFVKFSRVKCADTLSATPKVRQRATPPR